MAKVSELDEFIHDSLDIFFRDVVDPWDYNTYDPKTNPNGTRDLANAIDNLLKLKISPIQIRKNVMLLMKRWKRTRALAG